MNTPSLEILEPGPLATVQDRGRLGHQHLGVPVSGAMDLHAFRMGNMLVGNSPFEACLEITQGRFQARFLRDTTFAVTGSSPHAFLNRTPIPTWRALKARKGQYIRVMQSDHGFRDYLVLSGGIQVPLVLGSRSTYLRGKFGGFEGRALKTGDVLHTGPEAREPLPAVYPKQLIPPYSSNPQLRVVLGPQDSAFSQGGLEAFIGGTFTVTDRADRMGCRLSGSPIQHERTADIISDGLAMGAIQIPGNGQPLILLADRPTTGGYAKIANVISVDIPLIAQTLPGGRITFKVVSFYEAREIYLHKEFAIRRFMAGDEKVGA